MGAEIVSISTAASSDPVRRPRWRRRLVARCRLWCMNMRREMQLGDLDGRQRVDIGRQTVRNQHWLEPLMRGWDMRH